MISFFWRMIGIGFLMFGVLGCAATMPPTSAPLPTSTSDSAAVSNPLPHALKDVGDTRIYRFQVDPKQTTVEYAVHELLLGNNQLTRGRTNAVDGEFRLYMQKGQVFVALSNLQVDLRTLTSDNPLRDAAIHQDWLESDTYPKAIFVANSVQGLTPDAVQNQPYKFQVTGDMTIHNTTHPVTFDVTVTVGQNSIAGEGTATIYMKDFGFDPPAIAGKTIVSDPATITIKGVANLIDG